MMFWASLLDASVRLAIPILLVALGELIAQRSGVINIGLEGMMSAGAFAGFSTMVLTGDPFVASLAAVLAGTAASGVMAGAAIWGGVNQVLVGFALFVMVPGLTAFFYQQSESSGVVTPALPKIEVPGLSEIPLVGKALFAQNGYYYAAIALCLAIWFLLNKTRFGLLMTACGHDPEVAATKGIGVNRIRTWATLLCGGIAGLGGAALTVGALGAFSPGVTGGRGFIGIALVILGRWRLGGVVLAAAAIGLSDAFRLRISSRIDLPVQLLAMIPWLVVFAMLIAGARLSGMPRSLGRNFGAATAAT